jgi:hypothetical protein
MWKRTAMSNEPSVPVHVNSAAATRPLDPKLFARTVLTSLEVSRGSPDRWQRKQEMERMCRLFAQFAESHPVPAREADNSLFESLQVNRPEHNWSR